MQLVKRRNALKLSQYNSASKVMTRALSEVLPYLVRLLDLEGSMLCLEMVLEWDKSPFESFHRTTPLRRSVSLPWETLKGHTRMDIQ